MISRRGLFRAAGGAGLALAAPAIIRTAGLLMPIKPLPLSFVEWNKLNADAWLARYLESLEKVIRPPLTEAMQDLIVFGQSITRVTADGVVRVPPPEWHRSLPEDSVHRLESVPLK